MGIKSYNPYTPSRRHMTGSDFSEITDTVIFPVFRTAEVGHCIKFKSLCDRRPDLFRWQLYGRRISYRN